MVEQSLHVVHLVGGDNHASLLGHRVCHHASELCLRGDVESVGGFVHQEIAGVGGESKTHEHLLLLTHRQFVELMEQRQLKILQAALQYLAREIGIEHLVDLNVCVESHCGHLKLLGHHEDVAQDIWIALICSHSIHKDFSLLCTQQSTDEI